MIQQLFFPHIYTRVLTHQLLFVPTGRVQVTAPVDREEEERQNQRMYRPAEGSVTRTSEAIGEITTPQKKKV